jgi:hypothetical protein
VVAEPVLRADCSRCAGLCCVVLPFSRGPAFAQDKPAGLPCRHLDGSRCAIHADLATTGWRGCVDFDCFGAGQQVTQVTFAGEPWRHSAERVGEVFGIVRAIHEIRFLLSDPACRSSSYAAAATRLDGRLAAVAAGGPEELQAVDLDRVRAQAGDLFASVAAERGARSQRGEWLMGADLRGRDLTGVDLLGADLRAADVRGADLSRSLFLTQPQVNATRGDAGTRIPDRLERPQTWSTGTS